MQAMFTCNGLFTSQRSLEQIFDQELTYLGTQRLGNKNQGNYRIDNQTQSVEVGGGSDGPAVTAVFRSGIGCLAMAPGMTKETIAQLPEIERPTPLHDLNQLAWPQGDLLIENPLGSGISQSALNAASDWAFTAHAVGEDTTSLLIIHRGNLIHERYAPGFDYSTRTRTWSAAKSIEAVIIGLRVDSGHMGLDDPLSLDWLPEPTGVQQDPRSNITLRHALNMATGLYPLDNAGMANAAGSGLAY